MIVLLSIIWLPVATGAYVFASIMADRQRRSLTGPPLTADVNGAGVARRALAVLELPLGARLNACSAWWSRLGISGTITIGLPVLVVATALTSYTYSEVLLLAASASAAAWFVRLRLQGDDRAATLPLGGWLASYGAYVVTMHFFTDIVYDANIGDPTGDTASYWLDPAFSQVVALAVLVTAGSAFAWRMLGAGSLSRVAPKVVLGASAIACGTLAWSTMVFGVVFVVYSVAFLGLAIARLARAERGASPSLDPSRHRGDVLGTSRGAFGKSGITRNLPVAEASAVVVAGTAIATVPLVADHGLTAAALSLALAAASGAFAALRLRQRLTESGTSARVTDIAVAALFASLLAGGLLALPLAALTGYFDDRAPTDAATSFYILGSLLLVLSAAGILGILVSIRRGDVSRWGPARLALVWPAILVSPGAVARHSLDTGFAAADWVFCAVAVGVVVWIMSRFLPAASDASPTSGEPRAAQSFESMHA